MSTQLRDIAGLNRHESAYLYDEIFTKRAYLRHGLSLRPASTVFDVGANIGMFSLFVRTTCPGASIYAFEPLPPIFRKLEQNLSGMDRARLFCCGVGSRRGEATFTFYPGYSMMSGATTYADTDRDRRLVTEQALRESGPMSDSEALAVRQGLEALLGERFREEQYQCHIRPLSEIIDEYGTPRIDFLKIDVQRAEIDVLEGIRDMHWPRIEQIAMEVHDAPDDFTAGRMRKIRDMLEERQFDVFTEQFEGLSGTDRYNLFARRRQA